MENNICNSGFEIIKENLNRKPDAFALMKGSTVNAKINGKTLFYQSTKGVIVATEITGLPTATNRCKNPIFAFHIHSGNKCTGNATDPFSDALTHYNPNNCNHPYHSGDLPPIFGNNGYAVSVFLTNRFNVKEIIGRTIILHGSVDDFKTQPSGNSGVKIACGEIRKFN